MHAPTLALIASFEKEHSPETKAYIMALATLIELAGARPLSLTTSGAYTPSDVIAFADGNCATVSEFVGHRTQLCRALESKSSPIPDQPLAVRHLASSLATYCREWLQREFS